MNRLPRWAIVALVAVPVLVGAAAAIDLSGAIGIVVGIVVVVVIHWFALRGGAGGPGVPRIRLVARDEASSPIARARALLEDAKNGPPTGSRPTPTPAPPPRSACPFPARPCPILGRGDEGAD